MTTTHATGTREQWLAARLELLEAEKELTRRSDELARRRQRAALGAGREGRTASRRPTARRRSPTCSAGARSCSSTTSCSARTATGGCPSCSAIADGFNGSVVHLEHHDVALVAVSRAPIDELEAYKRRMGWTFTWASSRRQRLQLRLHHVDHGGAAALRERRLQLPRRGHDVARRRSSRAAHGAASFAAMAGTDVATATRASGRA